MFQLNKKTEEDKAKRAAEKEAKKAEKAEKKEEKEKRAKAEKAERALRKEKDKHNPSEAGDATSPHDSRMSRDTHSIISTADASEASPRESLERRASHTASENAGSIGKESFMQKLTRKGSTSQFLPFSKKSVFSKNKTSDVPGTPDEADETSGGFFGLGKSTESANNSPSIGTPKDKTSLLHWGSIKRIGKKDKTPSLHESIASEATGDEDELTEGTRA
jgi:hypothetical protein